MPFDFDAAVDQIDQIEKDHFADEFTINGESVSGIFDEGFTEFDDIDDFYTTLEVITSELPLGTTKNTRVIRVSDSQAWLITKIIPSDTKRILVLSKSS